MMAVAPAPAATTSASSSLPQPSAQRQGCYATLSSTFWRLWYAHQFSHSGRYSIERLLALEEYTRSTSLARVLLVCIGTPLPMVAIVFLQECVPLQDPSDGWSANYGFWIRAGILGGVVAVGMSSFAIYMIPGVKLSNLQLGLLFVTLAAGYPAIAMSVAALWVFPIPFMVLTIISLYVLLFAVLFRMIAGKTIFSRMATHRDELILLVSFSGSQAVMAFAYAAYAVLFDHVTNTSLELPVLLLLPVIKTIMKNVVSLTIVHMEDMVPEAIIFTVDFFNSLYLATCMQSTSSLTTVATVMTIDFGLTAIALRSLHNRTDTILFRLRQACGTVVESDSLLPVVGLLCRDTDKFMQQDRRDIILHSCLPHRLSMGGRCLLDILNSLPGNGERSIPRFSTPRLAEIRRSFRHSIENARVSTVSRSMLCCSSAKIEPRTATMKASVKPARSEATDANAGELNLHRKILRETLEVLFTSECLLLTEYLESIIPVFYGTFILLVVNLPSAPYHMDLVGVTPENVGDTVLHVYMYALLEFASFVMLTLLMMRNCRLQALYHLAFVLETQMLLVQVKLVTWVLMSLSFRVVHFGKCTAHCSALAPSSATNTSRIVRAQ